MKRILPLLTLMAIALTGCGAAGSGAEYRQIGMREAVEMMASAQDYVILDVRTAQEFAQGHIPGATLLPNEEIGDEAPAQLPEKDQLILVYCRSGNRSKQASAKLAKLGYTNVVEFGGIRDWPGEIATD